MNENKEPIAIVGIGCRLPGDSDSPSEFWDMLMSKTDAICDIPADRWDVSAFYNPDWKKKGRISVHQGGFIKDIEKFDAGFFGIPPVEALRMDPQQRMLLEGTYMAMEDAGIKVEDLDGTRTGVFIGLSAHDYGDLQQAYSERVNLGAQSMQGGASSIASNRISYVFNFKGPSFTVDTACSSSLVALHLACRSMNSGESDVAFVGGVNAILKPEPEMAFSKGGFLSPDCRCKAFDASANGYIRSEGMGVVMLKPLSKALADGDPIYTTIIGSALNEDGRTPGLAMPDYDAQVAVLTDAYKDAGIDPSIIDYVEAHGTGTAAGDPIELRSIGTVIGKKKKNKVLVGSVKSNIGHLEPASGIAGLIKLSLSMKNRKVPPNIHFNTPNPKIDFEGLRIEVPTEPTEIGSAGKPVFAGINSFGFGGANAHVVLKSAPEKSGKTEHKKNQSRYELFTLSARSADALKALAADYIDYLEKTDSSLADICFKSAMRRSAHDIRLSIACETKEDLADSLRVYLDDGEKPEIAAGRRGSKGIDKIGFVFSGQGPQWYGMGRELLQTNSIFRDTVAKVDSILTSLGWLSAEKSSLLTELSKSEEDSRINETEIAQPAIFALQAALADVWKASGITPDAVVGHSIGEVAAAYASGALDLEEATRIVFCRSRSQSAAAGQGKMCAIGVSREEAAGLIASRSDTINIAAVNGPKMVTVSGATDAVDALGEELEQAGTFYRHLIVDVPFHSYLLDPIKEDFLATAGNVKARSNTTVLYSTVTGEKIDGRDMDAAYWFRNIRQPVLFYPAVKQMLKDGINVFVEIAPHPILSRSIMDAMEGSNVKGISVASLRRNEKEEMRMTVSRGELFNWGIPLDWEKISSGSLNNEKLPVYRWQKEAFWLETEEGRKERTGTMVHPHLNGVKTGSADPDSQIWDILLEKRKDTYIEDHRVQGPLVYPGAGHVELAVSAGLNSFGDRFSFLEDINFMSALFLPDDGQPPHIQLEIRGDEGCYTIATKQRFPGAGWNVHSNGKMNHTGDEFRSEAIDLDAVKKRVDEAVKLEPLFDELLAGGLQLGPTFKGMKDLKRNDNEALGEIRVHDDLKTGFGQFNIHPALLDACFQTAFGIHKHKEDELMGVFIPVHIDRVKFYQKPQTHTLISYARKKRFEDKLIIADIWVYDSDRNPVLEIQGFTAQYLKGSKGEVAGEMDNWFYAYKWQMRQRRAEELIRTPAEHIATPVSIRKLMDDFVAGIVKSPISKRFLEVFEPDLDNLTWAYIVEALQGMDFDFTKGARFNPEQLSSEYGIIDRHRRLFIHMFRILKSAEFFKVDKDVWTVAKTPDSKPAAEILSEMLEKYPEFHYELALMARCGPYVREVVQGTVDPIGLIFPENDWESVIEYYTEGHSFKKYNEMVQHGLSELIKAYPENKVLKVLEVGAGTGGMSQAVLPILPADRTEYTYTDVSLMFSVKARERFAGYPFIQYSVLDIEKDPVGQGYDLHSFDIIVASDVLHATKNIKETMENVRKLVAPNGLVVMLEVTKTPIYLDLIFGMTEGWWMFQDLDIRKDHCTMPLKNWMPVLEELNFHDILPVTDVIKGDRSSQTVFFMRSPEGIPEEEKVDPARFAAEKGNWLILADQHGVADKMALRLKEDGHECWIVDHGAPFCEKDERRFTADPENRDDFHNIITRISQAEGAFNGILHAWALDSADTDSMSVQQLEQDQSLSCLSTLNIVKELVALNPETQPVFWIVTAGAENVAGDAEKLSLSQSPLWGLVRVIINEHPSLPAKVVDISSDRTEEELDQLYREISSRQPEDRKEEELAIRGNRRYSHKFARIDAVKAAEAALKEVPASGTAYRLETTEPGNPENLLFREMRRKELGGKQVRIDVKASALNFRDVMIAMGMLSDEAIEGGLFGRNFGLEFAGVVSEKGSEVSGFNVGDAVVGFTPSSLGGQVVAEEDNIFTAPEGMSFADAATIPMVYLTAWYSLHYLCRMEKGDRVLVHAAAGGVGIAAIKLAQLAGAEIYATCSTAKMDFVRSLGVKNIYDSRSLRFHDEIMKDTDGKGVDIVLNSIAGMAITQSIKTLAAYGRFVEIGKVDIYGNRLIGLKPFGNNLSYFAVDIDRLLKEKPALANRQFKEMMECFHNGSIGAHPHTDFPASDVIGAFKFLARSKQIGKVVVTMEEESVKIAPPAEIRFRKDASYLVVGGCGGFGLAVARWMAQKGAGTLALMSRSGVKTAEDQAVIDQMKAEGVRVEILKGDAASEADVKKILSAIKSGLPELKGIIQSAMVLDDNMLITMEKEKFMKVLRPKISATWILHRQTLDLDLDYFVPFSSIAALYGTPGQSNYAAANVFLDKFSHYRRAKGHRGNTVNWGVLGEVGFVARTEKVDSILASQGWLKFNLRQSTDCLERILLQNPVQAGAIAAEWEKVKETFPHNDSSLRFTHLFHENDLGSLSGGNESSALREALRECSEEERHSLLQGHVQESVAKILGTTRDKLDTETSVTKMGLDSLMANQLRTWIHNNTGVDYSLMRIMQGPGISELTSQVLEMMSAGPVAGSSENGKAEIDKWILRPERDKDAKKRLFCFSYLGGGASLFNGWADSLDDVEICMVQLPGREERIDEAPIFDNDELAKILSGFIVELSDKPFAFFGHSFGGGLAFALANHLKEHHGISPEHLFIGAAPSPDVENPLSDLFNHVEGDHMDSIPEESVYKLLKALKTEDSFVQDKALMDRMMPAIKADIVLMKNRHKSPRNKLSCPLTVVAGVDDDIYHIDKFLKPWEKYTDRFALNVVPGSHFFLKEETGREKLLAIIDSGLTD